MSLAQRPRGHTLLGLVLALGLGSAALAAAHHGLALGLRQHLDTIAQAQLQQDMAWVMADLVRRLENAQATANSERGPGRCPDRLCKAPWLLQAGPGELRWATDRQPDAAQPECGGLRLQNQALQTLWNCKDGDKWQPLTDTASVRVLRLDAQWRCLPWGSGWTQAIDLTVQARGPQAQDPALTWRRRAVLHNRWPQGPCP